MSDIGNKEIFAENLKRYMKTHNIDRRKLCESLGFKYTTVAEWLYGNKYPRINKIEMLANFFNIQKSDLIEKHKVSKTTPELSPELKELITTAQDLPPEKIKTLTQVAQSMKNT